MQYLYALEMSGFEDTKEHHKNLEESIQSIHHLFLLQISFLFEILKKSKFTYKVSKESISGNISLKYSNEKFHKNQFLNELHNNKKIQDTIRKCNYIDWGADYKYVNMIYEKIINHKIYSEYLNEKNNSFEIDLKFIYNIFKNLIVEDDKFQLFIEEKNLYWVDDFALSNSLILKFFNCCKSKSSKNCFYFELFSDPKDKKFSNTLANYSLNNFKENNNLIEKYLTNWDIERIAKIDLVIINIAITELKYFNEIPVKVSLNEYIEISKDYSTKKSNIFINGILDKIVKDLIKNNLIIKEGRGLRE
tara:strand:- start:61 stop:975 length:915 start_codon:yes stop_codon:yes gene_type:complete